MTSTLELWNRNVAPTGFEPPRGFATGSILIRPRPLEHSIYA